MTTTASALSEDDRRVLAVVGHYGAKDTHLGADETPFFPFMSEGIEVRLVRVEIKTGTFVVDLRSQAGGVLGRHRHRGSVSATTLAGTWNYLEYDWVAGPGDLVQEFPGTIHTLNVNPGAYIRFTNDGTLEFLYDDDTLQHSYDAWNFVDLYQQFCESTGQPFNEHIFF
jgi:quercetin dioxygenase-like cupin family protein